MMTIKKTSLLTVALLVSITVFGQKSKRTSANNYLQYGELDNAQEAIDPTITNEKTMNDAKTWFFRGQIYQAIYETKDEKYKSLSDNPLQVAFESFVKCKELDEKNFHTDMTLQYLNVQGQQFVNVGITKYNAKEYAGALQAFSNTIQASNIPEIKRTDSLAIYYTGASAEQTGDLVLAEKYYREAIAIDYKSEAAFIRMIRMYSDTPGNEDKAFELLKEGRAKFPNNQTMVTDEVNVYLKNDQHAEAVKSLEVAIAGEPGNASLHFAYGFVNDRLASKAIEANPEGNDVYKAYLASAEKSYAKSVELDGTNFDAVYNLGALYFNQAVKMNEAANLIDDMKKFEVARDAADAVFEKALPILENAYEINPDDKGVLGSLKQLYYRKMAKDEAYKTKYDEIIARMK
ncbi:MAG: tetratricopeptide (TPR) repeat protein [Bacteroidia bacterium]|jgi:tetratricopeptide (TPR) repeat protein